jgi:predicted acetyltransferase
VPELCLRPFVPADAPAAEAAHEELAADGFTFLLDRDRADGFAAYCELLDRQARGEDDHPHRVPAALLAVEAAGVLVGRVSIRYVLNDHLRHEGGHVGYGIRPAYRGRGYATATLVLAVDHLKGRDVTEVLVTCDDDNVASAATIVRCGGVLEDVRTRHDGSLVRRYWIA